MENIIERDIFELNIHEIAEMNPMCNKEDRQALRYSIETIGGLIQPLLTYRGKVVDGRNRLAIYKELFEETNNNKWSRIRTKSLSSTLSIEEVEEIVVGLDARRHKTSTQKAIQSWIYWKSKVKEDPKFSMTKSASMFGSNRAQISRVNTLATVAGELVINTLFAGNKIEITKEKKDGTMVKVATDSMDTLTKYYKKLALPAKNEEIIAAEEIAYCELLTTELNEYMSNGGLQYLIRMIEIIKDNRENLHGCDVMKINNKLKQYEQVVGEQNA